MPIADLSLQAEGEPELPDYPQNPEFQERFGIRGHQIHLVGEAAEVLEDAAQGPGGYESGFHLIGYQQGFPLCICKVLSLRLQNMRFYFQLNFVAQFVLGNFHIVSHLQIKPELRFNTKTFPEA